MFFLCNPLAKANGNDKYGTVLIFLFIAVPFMGRIAILKIGALAKILIFRAFMPFAPKSLFNNKINIRGAHFYNFTKGRYPG